MVVLVPVAQFLGVGVVSVGGEFYLGVGGRLVVTSSALQNAFEAFEELVLCLP